MGIYPFSKFQTRREDGIINQLLNRERGGDAKGVYFEGHHGLVLCGVLEILNHFLLHVQLLDDSLYSRY